MTDQSPPRNLTEVSGDTESRTDGPGGISRRDLIHGVALAGLGSMLPSSALADAVEAASTAPIYPPAKTGLRGNHDGSWETAHLLARHGKSEFGPSRAVDGEAYDLVVVGGGLSGLAAAYFYREKKPNARILILDNHDDFGGHAKRNEFSVGGRTLLGYGGSQTMQEPSGYPEVVKRLMKDIGVSFDDFYEAYDEDFYRRHDLGAGVFFNRSDWGESRTVRFDLTGYGDYLPVAASRLSAAEAVRSMPLSSRAQEQLTRAISETRDRIPNVPEDEKADYLYGISYRRFLEQHLGVTEPELFRLFQDMTFERGLGFESTSAGNAMLWNALPGIGATGLPSGYGEFEPYIHHFPDGNASVARLLVKALMPHMSDAGDMYEILGERFDYARLDDATSKVRLRLSSTAVNVQHLGPESSAKEVQVTYVRDGVSETVRAAHTVLACYHSIVPSLCPELPAVQREAMAQQVKTPILYTNVALRNWHAWKEMGLAAFYSPTAYHATAMLDFPVSFGDYSFARSPDDPIMVHMARFPYGRGPGLSKRERHRAGRHELLSTPYADIERSIREQLGEALAGGGFKAERDIAGITVNRWAHGYSYDYDSLADPMYDDWDDPRYPHVQARQPFGRIAIANSDAAANAMLESAVEEAYRAVRELI
ncbi:MAG: FAD/NAD(P)-binding protein [Pseudomonadota bacterium]